VLDITNLLFLKLSCAFSGYNKTVRFYVLSGLEEKTLAKLQL